MAGEKCLRNCGESCRRFSSLNCQGKLPEVIFTQVPPHIRTSNSHGAWAKILSLRYSGSWGARATTEPPKPEFPKIAAGTSRGIAGGTWSAGASAWGSCLGDCRGECRFSAPQRNGQVGMNGDTFSIKAPKECSKKFAGTFKREVPCQRKRS